ncbi:MAG: acyl carrier protein [Methylobacterium sp.]
MNRDAVYEQLTAVFRDVFQDDTLTIAPETTAQDVAGWDSGRMIELIMTAESRFGIRFTSREVDAMARVADFAETIARKTAGQG